MPSLTQIKNWGIILLGGTLINNYNYLVRWNWHSMSQEWTNPKRTRPYSLDDKSWRLLGV